MTEKSERQELLIAALRSGEYSQGKGYLNCKEGFCCLGVACDVYRKQTGEGVWVSFLGESKGYTLNGDTQYSILPPEVQNWFGFNSPWGASSDDNSNSGVSRIQLAFLNDSGKTFDEIAEILSTQKDKYFYE